jgi:hypothetical protein
MHISKSALAFTAAAALMISQSAAASAAPARAGSPVAESEELGESPSAAPFLAAFAVFLVVGLVLLLSDDDDDSPVSP